MILRPWLDMIWHAQYTSEISNPVNAITLGDPDMAGQPLRFYHYASYVLPASLEAWSGSGTALDCAVAVWVPLGVVCLALAAFSLGTEWWGDAGGLAAAAAVLVLPDAPMYAIPVGWFSYYWLLLIAPASGYGIASAAVGLLFVDRGTRIRDRPLIIAGATLLLLTVLLKAQIAIVAVPLGMMWFLHFQPGWTVRRRGTIIALTIVACLACLAALDRLMIGPNILPIHGHAGVIDYVRAISGQVSPGWWRERLVPILAGHASSALPKWVAAAAVLFVVGPLGGLAFAWPMLLIARRKQIALHDAWPIMALIVYLTTLLVAPPNRRGAIAELWHRPFVWLYFLIATWCAGTAASFLPKGRRWPELFIVASAAVLLVVPTICGRAIQSGSTSTAMFANTRLPAGLIAAAAYIRARADAMDVVQDRAIVEFPYLTALAERRAYLSQSPEFWHRYFPGSPMVAEGDRRASVIVCLREADTEQRIGQLVRETGIRWYIAHPEELLSWPAARLEHPCFQSSGFRVYDLRMAAD